MKKKIFICMHSLEIGGVERSLIGLLNSFDFSTYDVDLFLYSHQGEWLSFIPEQVNLLSLDESCLCLVRPIKEAVRQRRLAIALARLLGKAVSGYYVKIKKFRDGCYITKQYGHKYALPFLSKITKKYDLAISFLDPHYFVAKNVDARVKIAWIHTDFSMIDVDKQEDFRMWNDFDYIATVSASCRDSFLKIYPEIASKTIIIENILSPQFILQQADVDVLAEMPDEPGIIKLCTVGRFSYAKAFDNAVQICKRLLDMGCRIKWYAIGYGGDEFSVKAKIKELQMEDTFIILGKKNNPYPYMNSCNIYVQPSRYEGKAVAVREAQILCKPVIITNFATAPSQLKDGYDGIIVPMDIEQCALGIKAVMEDIHLQQRLINNMKNHDYGNEREVEKIYRLINS